MVRLVQLVRLMFSVGWLRDTRHDKTDEEWKQSPAVNQSYLDDILRFNLIPLSMYGHKNNYKVFPCVNL